MSEPDHHLWCESQKADGPCTCGFEDALRQLQEFATTRTQPTCSCGHDAAMHTAVPLGGPEDRPCWAINCPCHRWDVSTTRTSPQLSEGMVERAAMAIQWEFGWSAVEELHDVDEMLRARRYARAALTAALADQGNE